MVCCMDSLNVLFLVCKQFNSAARIVTQERLRDHDSMSRALMELHWFPVDKRIEYKLLLYTYKVYEWRRCTVHTCFVNVNVESG